MSILQHNLFGGVDEVEINPTDESVIAQLSENERFYVTLISILHKELTEQQIITPMQRNQIEKYVLDKMK